MQRFSSTSKTFFPSRTKYGQSSINTSFEQHIEYNTPNKYKYNAAGVQAIKEFDQCRTAIFTRPNEALFSKDQLRQQILQEEDMFKKKEEPQNFTNLFKMNETAWNGRLAIIKRLKSPISGSNLRMGQSVENAPQNLESLSTEERALLRTKERSRRKLHQSYRLHKIVFVIFFLFVAIQALSKFLNNRRLKRSDFQTHSAVPTLHFDGYSIGDGQRLAEELDKTDRINTIKSIRREMRIKKFVKKINGADPLLNLLRYYDIDEYGVFY